MAISIYMRNITTYPIETGVKCMNTIFINNMIYIYILYNLVPAFEPNNIYVVYLRLTLKTRIEFSKRKIQSDLFISKQLIEARVCVFRLTTQNHNDRLCLDLRLSYIWFKPIPYNISRYTKKWLCLEFFLHT